MTETDYVIMILKMLSLFFFLGYAYAVSMNKSDDV